MAKQLPATNAWPDLRPEANLNPYLAHVESDVESLVEEHHCLMAYWGRGHVSQNWPPGTGAGSPANSTIQSTSSAVPGTEVLRYMIVPRLGMTTIKIDTICKSDNGGTVRIYCPDTVTQVDIAVAAGAEQFDTGILLLNRQNLVTNITVYLRRDVAGAYIDLLSLSINDANLTAGTLP